MIPRLKELYFKEIQPALKTELGFKNLNMGPKIEKVVLSARITESPCVLLTGEVGWSANMERIMKAQALRDNQMPSYMMSKKTMEINPKHCIIKEMNNRYKKDKNDKTIKDLINLMYESTLINSGFSLDEPSVFVNRINNMIKLGLNLEDEEENNEDNLENLEESEIEESKMEEVD